jgi:class 3 adenylate cyclase
MSLGERLATRVSNTLALQLDIRDGRVVPATEDITLTSEGVQLDGTVLYSDLSRSSAIATDFQHKTAAKIISAFLYCMAALITENGGVVTAFDGDRVMGIFLGDHKNTSATKCALQMNHAVLNLIGPKVAEHFTAARETGLKLTHCVGVDTSTILAVRAGQRSSNDIVWVGRAPNFAAKLSELRNSPYNSFISDTVFTRAHESSKLGGSPPRQMWKEHSYNFLGENVAVYGSEWTWSF